MRTTRPCFEGPGPIAQTLRDEVTGVEVVRLSDDVGDTIHPYFTQPLFSEDGKLLLLGSNRTGSWQLYSLEVETGLVTQLTEEPGIEPHRSCLDPERLIAYYFSGRILKSVELSLLRTEEIYVDPDIVLFCHDGPGRSCGEGSTQSSTSRVHDDSHVVFTCKAGREEKMISFA